MNKYSASKLRTKHGNVCLRCYFQVKSNMKRGCLKGILRAIRRGRSEHSACKFFQQHDQQLVNLLLDPAAGM